VVDANAPSETAGNGGHADGRQGKNASALHLHDNRIRNPPGWGGVTGFSNMVSKKKLDVKSEQEELEAVFKKFRGIEQPRCNSRV
jgi:hypothetical protein